MSIIGKCAFTPLHTLFSTITSISSRNHMLLLTHRPRPMMDLITRQRWLPTARHGQHHSSSTNSTSNNTNSNQMRTKHHHTPWTYRRLVHQIMRRLEQFLFLFVCGVCILQSNRCPPFALAFVSISVLFVLCASFSSACTRSYILMHTLSSCLSRSSQTQRRPSTVRSGQTATPRMCCG